MGNQDTDKYLLKLIEEVSYIKGAISGLKEQVDKLDERIVDPFQEWLHNVKVHSTDIQTLKSELKELNEKRDKQDLKIKEMEDQLKSTKWYAAGMVGAISFIVYCIYQGAALALQFFSR